MWDLHKNVLILKTKKEWIHLNKQKKVESLKNGLIKTKNKKSGVVSFYRLGNFIPQ